MGIFYYIDTAQHLMVLLAEGEVADEQFVEDIKTALNDPGVGPGLRVLFDLRGVEQFNVKTWSIYTIAAAAQYIEGKCSGVKMGIVTANSLIYGMARMYKILRRRAPSEIRIFRTCDEAEDWLGIVRKSASQME